MGAPPKGVPPRPYDTVDGNQKSGDHSPVEVGRFYRYPIIYDGF